MQSILLNNLSKFKKMDFKKILGDVLVVMAGVAAYNLLVKPMVDKATTK
jgi:hypothetical protein